jgi:hypothetical protein
LPAEATCGRLLDDRGGKADISQRLTNDHDL